MKIWPDQDSDALLFHTFYLSLRCVIYRQYGSLCLIHLDYNVMNFKLSFSSFGITTFVILLK